MVVYTNEDIFLSRRQVVDINGKPYHFIRPKELWQGFENARIAEWLPDQDIQTTTGSYKYTIRDKRILLDDFLSHLSGLQFK